jgi:hypothetical protein
MFSGMRAEMFAVMFAVILASIVPTGNDGAKGSDWGG